MNGNRYRNNNRFARSSNNGTRWRNDQSFPNMCSFGYRRHELNEDSPANIDGNEALVRHFPVPGTVNNQETGATINFRGHSQRGRVRNEASRPTRFQENYLAPLHEEQRAERGMHLEDDTAETMKAAFDTDFRIQSPVRSQDQWRSQPRNIHGNVAEAPQVPKRLPPILKKTHNPWQQSNNFGPNENHYNFAQVSNREHGGNSFAQNGQRESNAFRNAGVQNIPWNHAPETRPGPSFVEESENKERLERGWHPPFEHFNQTNSRGYFDKLKQQEHHKNMFGNREVSLKNLHASPSWGSEGNQNSSFVNCREELSFSTFGAAGGASSQNLQAPENQTAVNNNFQGTWRDRNEGSQKKRNNFHQPGKQNARGNRGRPYMQNQESSGQVKNKPYERNWNPQRNPVASPAPKEQQHWEDANGPEVQKFQDWPNHRPLDARAILERKRKCAVEESLGSQPQLEDNVMSEESLVQPGLPLLHSAKASEDLDQKRLRVQDTESPRKNTQRWIESHFSENEPFKAVVPDVHEVDETKLLPADVPLDRLLHVVFVDIDKRSFFEEVKQAFLPGTLVYLFFGDPSVLLPTKEHPFYKENKDNWVYFYPDCGTEYGSYLVAAPAVIGWMDQQLPQRVKFLVHGHQKQLKLEDLQRKVTFYPTSRTMDVQLLNRMLNGDFEPPQMARTGVPTGKTVVIRKNPKSLLPTPPSTSHVPHYAEQKGMPARQSAKQRIQPVVAPTNTTNTSKRTPIVPPGQSVKPDAPPQRKKIVW